MDDTAKLCIASAEIYEYEKHRIGAVYPFIDALLGVQLSPNVDVGNKSNKATEADGLVLQPIDDVAFEKSNGIVAHVEVKNEMGISGQCGLQNDLSLRKHVTLPMVRGLRVYSF